MNAIDSVRRVVLRRSLWIVGLLLFAFLPVSAALPDQHRVDRVSVFERGIYRASGGGSPIAVSSFGSVTKVRDVSLVQSTTTIFARKSLRFGLRYVIAGSPSGAPVDIRLVTRFPTGGVLDPVAGTRHYASEYNIRGAIGVPAYREFMFDQSWEIVAGEWVFEFWQAGRNIGSQRFCVLDAESTPNQSATLHVHCGFLIGQSRPGIPSDRL